MEVRNARGQFAAGHKGGPGRKKGIPNKKPDPPTSKELLFQLLNDDEITQVVTKLLEKAKKGHYHSIQLVLGYRFGRPNQTFTHQGIDSLLDREAERERLSLVYSPVPGTNGRCLVPDTCSSSAAREPSTDTAEFSDR